MTGIAGQADDDPPYDAGYRLAPREPEDLAFVPLPPVREILLGALILLVAAAIVLL
ncbi:MAG: hypothetical protein GWN02_08095, partial [Gemmatimonadetes bacterium]|nr:hypothetical protein [Gemmatimonadota bacterium]